MDALNATGINDSGEIVGEGLYDGKEQAFLMTPDAVNAPEPASWLVFGLLLVVASRHHKLSTSRMNDLGASSHNRLWYIPFGCDLEDQTI